VPFAYFSARLVVAFTAITPAFAGKSLVGRKKADKNIPEKRWLLDF